MKVRFLVFFLCLSLIVTDRILLSSDQKSWLNITSLLPSSWIQKIIQMSYPVQTPSHAVSVNFDPSISIDEQQALHSRMTNVQKVLQKEFGIVAPLRLGFCCSGGGSRAMVGTLGLLSGAAKTKVLDATLYLAGVSGSTWLIFLLSQLMATTHKNASIQQALDDIYHNYLMSLSQSNVLCVHDICTLPILPFSLQDNFLKELVLRYAYDQPLTLINLFGPLVGNYAFDFLGDNRLDAVWSSIAPELKNGNQPIPLCASIYEDGDDYEWVEISPFQAGNNDIGYVPLQYFGSSFHKGILNNYGLCFEYPISFYAGMCGSAFAITIQELLNQKKMPDAQVNILDLVAANQSKSLSTTFSNIWYLSILHSNVVQNELNAIFSDVLNHRIPMSYAKVSNFAYGLGNLPIHEEKDLGLFDAGIDFNFPIPTLMNRKNRDLDLIIMYDSHPVDMHSLQRIDDYVATHNVSFPLLAIAENQEVLSKQSMTVINDPRNDSYCVNLPTVLYFPTLGIDISQPPYITLNFNYSSDQVAHLVQNLEQAFCENIEIVRSVMTLLAQKKYKQFVGV